MSEPTVRLLFQESQTAVFLRSRQVNALTDLPGSPGVTKILFADGSFVDYVGERLKLTEDLNAAGFDMRNIGGYSINVENIRVIRVTDDKKGVGIRFAGLSENNYLVLPLPFDVVMAHLDTMNTEPDADIEPLLPQEPVLPRRYH